MEPVISTPDLQVDGLALLNPQTRLAAQGRYTKQLEYSKYSTILGPGVNLEYTLGFDSEPRGLCSWNWRFQTSRPSDIEKTRMYRTVQYATDSAYEPRPTFLPSPTNRNSIYFPRGHHRFPDVERYADVQYGPIISNITGSYINHDADPKRPGYGPTSTSGRWCQEMFLAHADASMLASGCYLCLETPL